MKVTTVAAMTVAVTMIARAGEVTVYVQGLSVVPGPVLNRAQILASKMFVSADVKIEWRRGGPSHSQAQRDKAIVVDMTTETPKQLTPGALAFAFPYQGDRITVSYDRVRKLTEPNLTPTVLAHVLVHEITHVLQGTDWHSDSGVMKARWTANDYAQMARQPLSFTEADIDLIRSGLAKRGNHDGSGRILRARSCTSGQIESAVDSCCCWK